MLLSIPSTTSPFSIPLISSFLFFVFSLFSSFNFAYAQNGPTKWTISPFNPPSMPLAVKSPYMNAWAPLGNGPGALSAAFPRTWTRELEILGWYASVRVDDTAYQVLGAEVAPDLAQANQTSGFFTPTQTSFLLNCAGKVTVNMTFVSPIEATDLARLSQPFSYLQMTVNNVDSSSHDVQVYVDMSGEWISGDDTAVSNWTISEQTDFVYLQMQLTQPQAYIENANRAQDSILYHAMNRTDLTSWQIGNSDTTRTMFANGTALNKTADSDFHEVGDPFDTVAFTVDLGTIAASSSSDPAIFAFGVVRDPVIKFVDASTLQEEDRSAYYWTNFSTINDVIEDVLGHYESALSAANALDAQIENDANSISSEYYGLLALSTRQAMGMIEYTLKKDSSGSFNTSDIKAFMKDSGSVGVGGSSDSSSNANPVDVIYAAMPIYLYLNPNILGYLLSPLLSYQESVQYVNQYAAANLGGNFPSVPGNFESHDEKIEQSANMLIMALAHAQTSGDGSLLAEHYSLLKEWTEYLVNNTLSPGDDQPSASDYIQLVNQTNVALKGVIAIGSMSKIADAVGESSDSSHYSSVASSYASQVLSSASSSSADAIAFGSGSSGFLYNLYADTLLGLDLIDSSLYSAQNSYYSSAISSNQYGIVVDSSNSTSIARADWMLFCASIATDSDVRNNMINQVYDYVSVNKGNDVFSIQYDASTGEQVGGSGSSAVGAMFAPLALSVSKKDISTSGVGGGSSSSSKTSTGAIVGGVVGGVAVLAIIGAIVFFWRRRGTKAQGRYNQDMAAHDADRILPIRVKPVSYPSELEPLSATMHPGMDTIRASPYATPAQRSIADFSVLPYPGPSSSVGGGTASSTLGPMAIRNLADGEHDRNDAAYAAILAASQAGSGSRGAGSSSAGGSGPKAVMQQEALRSEVDELRQEIERMKEERMATGEAPPSYEEELRFADALAKQNYRSP